MNVNITEQPAGASPREIFTSLFILKQCFFTASFGYFGVLIFLGSKAAWLTHCQIDMTKIKHAELWGRDGMDR